MGNGDLTRRKLLSRLGVGVTSLHLPLFLSCKESVGAELQESTLCESVRDLGPQFLGNAVNITGQDGATSCRLPDGDSLWLFGDSVEGPFESIRHHDLTEVLSNTASIVPKQDYSEGIKKYRYLTEPGGERARQVIKFDATEDRSRHRLWPIHSTCVGKSIYAFYHKITMDPKRDVFETFELNGMGIARAKIGGYQFERLLAPDGTKEYWKGDQPGFGVFAEQLPDGYLYLWGCFWTGMFLARTRVETIEQLDRYEYLVDAPTRQHPNRKPVWSPKFANAAVLFDNVPNELSVSYNPYLKRHVAIHVLGRKNQLAIRTAPQIFGPWSAPEVFYRAPRIREDDLFTAAKEHPEMRGENGRRMYVTYVNSTNYIPTLLEVRLR